MLAVIIASTLFLANIPTAGIVADTMDSLPSCLGPLCMLVTGMTTGEADMHKVFSNGRMWMFSSGRLIIFPLLLLLVIRLTSVAALVENGEMLFYISAIEFTSCSSTTFLMMAQIYNKDAASASAINIATNRKPTVFAAKTVGFLLVVILIPDKMV